MADVGAPVLGVEEVLPRLLGGGRGGMTYG